MIQVEFFIYNDELCYISNGKSYKFDMSDTDIANEITEIMKNRYPDAYKALSKLYEKSADNPMYQRWLIVKRFCKCNFGNLDTSVYDISGSKLGFEKVQCPLRGECPLEGIVCMPKFKSPLSNSELRVMKLVYDGFDNEEISKMLYLSVFTVKNHVKSVYSKLGIHEKAEFVRYANNNDLFTE